MRIIATSRQPLNVPGEQLFRVPPLDIDAAVELFTDHAKRAVGPDVVSAADAGAIARIVARLDGIALAIELASARTNMLTLADLEQHLSERFQILSGTSTSLARHQTMRTTLDWSYDLLGSRERDVFGRLWVFQGGFSLDAAVAVHTDERLDKWQIFETLASLVDKSLVNSAREGAVQRYRLLETTRAYASERMSDPAGIASLRRRHAAYYGCLAQRAAMQFEAADSTTAWAQSLEPDLENFRSALDWQLHLRDDVAAGVEMLSNLQELWIVQGIAAEAARRAHEILAAAADLPNAVQAALWLTIARMRQELFEHPGLTLESASRARELYEKSGDRRGLALAIRQQAAAHMRLGEHSQARTEFERSLEIYRELGDRRMIARGLGYLASLLQVQGQYVEARAMLLDVLQLARSTGDDRMIPTIAMNLAETEFALGDCANAADRARENLSDGVLRKSCDMLATQEANLSVYLLACGHLEDARAMALASIEDAAGSFIAVPLQHLAASIAVDDPACAAKILGYVEETFTRTAFSREHTERFSFGYLTRALRCELESGQLEAYRREGASMNEKQVLDLARGPYGRVVR
jgi:predicted ATPase